MSPDDYQDLPLIKVVGISASGKSTLVKALRQRGYHARPVSQEHSNVAELWQYFEQPAILIYLDVDLATQQERRPDVTWNKAWLQEEKMRLDHAQGHAELKINTSGLSPATVLQIALTFLQNERIRHAARALPPLNATGSARQGALEVDDHEAKEEPKRRLTWAERRQQKRQKRAQDQSPAK
jgi:hypothetical protein